nr:23S rRNA (pseudouridine(1915)-N(3))-methyltransferase RlmH [Actinomycetota bacterium]
MIRRITIVAVGSLKGWAADGVYDYLKRLRRFFPVEVVEVPEVDLNQRSPKEVLVAEADRLLKRIPSGAYVIALD